MLYKREETNYVDIMCTSATQILVDQTTVDVTDGVDPKLYGDRGQQGETGDRGSPGVKGAPGPSGDVGRVGAKGSKGDKGNDGASIPGDEGEPGELGEEGEKGLTGPGGNTGGVGDKGPAGDSGGVVVVSEPYDKSFHSWPGAPVAAFVHASGATSTMVNNTTDTGIQIQQTFVKTRPDTRVCVLVKLDGSNLQNGRVVCMNGSSESVSGAFSNPNAMQHVFDVVGDTQNLTAGVRLWGSSPMQVTQFTVMLTEFV
jgi:hypothetical protein